MKRTATLLAALAVAFAATAATVRTATENFVTNKIAEAVAAIPSPDYSTNNTELVETIQAEAPAPGDYATVSNRAMNAASRADVEAGWWSEWTILRDGVDVTAQVEQPYYETDPEAAHQDVWVIEGSYVPGDSGIITDGSQPDAVSLSWDGFDQGDTRHAYTATRHRVAAPVPTKPEDIGAQAALTFDTTPMAGSTNPVTSCGIKTALDGKRITIQVGGGDYITVNDTVMLPSDYDGTSTNPDAIVLKSGLDAVTTLTPTFSEWVVDATGTSYAGTDLRIVWDGSSWSLYSDNSFIDPPAPSVNENATSLHFEVQGVTATRSVIGYTLGEQTDKVLSSTNYTDLAIANADTTYRRTIGLTNLNQSVQYVNITDTAPTTLAISMPTDGATKDWMVYVVSVTNVTLSLPSATWWMADTAYTNDVPPATPTAFWFSQVTDAIFILGRQELTEVTP